VSGEDDLSGTDPQGLPQPLDLTYYADLPIRPREEIFPGLANRAVLGVFADGGSGKSALMLHLEVCIATGRPFFGVPTKKRKAHYLSCEDSEDIVLLRLKRICAYEGISINDLADQLEIMVLTGHDATLFDGQKRTPAFNALGEWIKDLKSEVLLVDGIADTFGGNENDRIQVKQYLNALIALVPPERGAVIVIGHVPKADLLSTGRTANYSGSTAWSNGVRGRYFLHHETEGGSDWNKGRAIRTGRLLMELQKSNYGPSDLSMSFVWDEAAELFVGERIQSAETRSGRAAQESAEKDGIIEAGRSAVAKGQNVPAAKVGAKTSFHVLSTEKAFPATLKRIANRRRFWRLLQELQTDQLVLVDTYTSGSRHPQERLLFP
jgi:RecA-family ATPase